MSQEPIFEQACQLLLGCLREEMVPAVLRTEDTVQLIYPGADKDFRFGVFLYGIEAVRPNGPPTAVRINESERRHPDRLLALRFLLFANRKSAFDSLDSSDEMLLLEASVRAIHSMAPMEIDGQQVKVQFHELNQGEKASLWQGISSPLQPAVYLTIEPLRIPSTRIKRVPPVREISVSAHRRGGD